MAGTTQATELNLVEASIEDLQRALSSGAVTSVELVARYLRRISTYDCRHLALNAIPILNSAVFDDAAQSDDRRAAGGPAGALEGIPYTIKDSYKAQGMPVAAGSPAFQNLMSDEDAFIVSTIRAAGGVLVGRTNMPAMACGGMQRGIWGRAENPYNPDYLAAGFASGSSNGSAVSTAASFAAFGLGAETVSSGRSPASNNALVAYTPSRGWVSGRGNWPLYPTCDVPVPHTRTVRDLLCLLDVIAVEDPVREGEFWREQSFVSVLPPWHNKPAGSTFKQIASPASTAESLSGVRVAVPQMFIGCPAPPGARNVETSPAVVALWEQARKDLEALGAEVVLTPDFPAQTAYENDALLPEGCPRRPDNWNAVERGPLIAHAWNDFLKTLHNPALPDLAAVDTATIYPDWLRTEPELQFFEKPNAIQYHTLKAELEGGEQHRLAPGQSAIQGLEEAVVALEGMRKVLFEDWLRSLGCDCAVFPAAGDVGPASADSTAEGAALAWRNGTYYSNGNRAIRHLGIPTVSVPMGLMRDKQVPMNLTFAGKAGDDLQLLAWAYAFEARTHHRVPPPTAPALDSDRIPLTRPAQPSAAQSTRPDLAIESATVTGGGDAMLRILVQGHITVNAASVPETSVLPVVEVTVDGAPVSSDDLTVSAVPQTRTAGKAVFSFEVSCAAEKPVERQGLERTWAPVARDKTMVVILAREALGMRPTGWLGLL